MPCKSPRAATPPIARASEKLLDAALSDLDTLLEQAPNRGEAVYLLAMVHGLALNMAEVARCSCEGRESAERQGVEAPLRTQRKRLPASASAEEALGRETPKRRHGSSTRSPNAGVLVDRIPTSLVKVRLLNVRSSLQAGQPRGSRAGYRGRAQGRGADAEQRRGIEMVCDALETLIAVREGDPPAILRHTEASLTGTCRRAFPIPMRISSRNTSKPQSRECRCRLAPRGLPRVSLPPGRSPEQDRREERRTR